MQLRGPGCLDRRLRRDRRGVTALEYALIAALIAGVIVVSVGSIGQTLANGMPYIRSYL